MTAEAMTPASLSDLIADVKSLATSAAAGDDATIPLSDDEVQELGKGILKLLDALQASQPAQQHTIPECLVEHLSTAGFYKDITLPCGAAGDVTRDKLESARKELLGIMVRAFHLSRDDISPEDITEALAVLDECRALFADIQELKNALS